MLWQLLKNSPQCIYVRPFINVVSCQLLRCGKVVGTPLRVNKRIGIAKTKVNKFHVISNTGEHNVVGLQIKMKHLVGMQIANGI